MVAACHLPLRAVSMAGAFNYSGIWRRDAPPAPICSTTGNTFSARASARALFTAAPFRHAQSCSEALSGIDQPSLTPRAFATASAALVRSEIARPSCSATAAMMCSTKRFASGISAAVTSTPLSRRFAIKATLRARRSSLAMRNTAPDRFALPTPSRAQGALTACHIRPQQTPSKPRHRPRHAPLPPRFALPVPSRSGLDFRLIWPVEVGRIDAEGCKANVDQL